MNIKKQLIAVTLALMLSQTLSAQQAAGVLAPPAQPAPVQSAVSNLQQNVESQVAKPEPAKSIVDQDDESALLREVARSQARLSILQLQGQIEKSELDIERERMKFEDEKREAAAAQNKLAAAVAPAAAGAVQPGVVGAPIQIAAPKPMPSLSALYSFDGRTFAEFMIDGAKVSASPGDVLPNGDKFVRASSASAVISRKGKETVLMISAAPSKMAAPGG